MPSVASVRGIVRRATATAPAEVLTIGDICAGGDGGHRANKGRPSYLHFFLQWQLISLSGYLFHSPSLPLFQTHCGPMWPIFDHWGYLSRHTAQPLKTPEGQSSTTEEVEELISFIFKAHFGPSVIAPLACKH